MRFSALRYFLETARFGSIRQAADELHVAPSAISRQIALLEQEFGMPLFERHASGVRLTQAGEALAHQARVTVRDFERLHSEIDDLQQLRRGLVRIASVWASLDSVVYPAIAEFARDYPGITYDVRTIAGMQAITAIANELCDIAIGFEPAPHRDVEWIEVIRVPIVAVMHPNHPLASRAMVTLNELADHVVALPNEMTVTRTLLDEALARERLSLQAMLTYDHIGFAGVLAQSGRFISFAPDLMTRAAVSAGLLRTALIDYPSLLSARLVLCRHKTRPPNLAAEAFISALRRHLVPFDAEARPPTDSGVA